MDADPGTPEGDQLDMLVSLVEQQEKEKHPIDLPAPVRAPMSGGRGGILNNGGFGETAPPKIYERYRPAA